MRKQFGSEFTIIQDKNLQVSISQDGNFCFSQDGKNIVYMSLATLLEIIEWTSTV